MNLMDELKLMIYESNLDEEEMRLCLDAVAECTTDDEFFETANDVVCLMEGNAYNKIASKYQNELNYNKKKMSAFNNAGLEKQARKTYDHINYLCNHARDEGVQDLDIYNSRGSIGQNFGNSPGKQNANNRRYKQTWMLRHGNEGTSPEEKYKAGRYLKLQNKLKALKKQYKQK